MVRIKTVEPTAEGKRWCNLPALATEMTREEIVVLMGWCDWQEEDLWNDMSLQEILNVYRVSAEWENWESWAQEDWKAAYRAWNHAVINPGNKMRPRLER